LAINVELTENTLIPETDYLIPKRLLDLPVRLCESVRKWTLGLPLSLMVIRCQEIACKIVFISPLAATQ
jgi:hypothetical protein